MAADPFDTTQEALTRHAPKIASPTSYLHPTDAYGQTFLPSYTRYQNNPAQSYTHPLFSVFNDRRPAQAKIRTSLTPQPAGMDARAM